ncbi:extracellular solute-binding protein [Marinithermus hydrothermalis]|uniref:Extracellular solute-binding protein family 1 n=1 Tax=Marinithermus hydrothermalis (strain DSM 14884 / JCM 11576 / T1) TaxID=869210 RepID=F2NKR5_MARHT|nr:extracellular solute-binding protein [Marinithermus hydrothermalis]AEB10828.1 extracellular solute-binding protein family 1 [Marinithermus hydrothermalis DSM 14884]
MKRWFSVLLTGILAASAFSYAAEELVVYSGRSEVLVEPLVERFEAQTGIRVKVRYGRDAELLATLAEEGARSPADLFWANTAGALGAAVNEGLLAPLPEELLALPEAFTPSSGRWVPLTARFRVLAYNPEVLSAEALPESVMDLPKRTELAGRIGWTPNYSSFQDFITAMRHLYGPEATLKWLEGMKALRPKAYASNSAMLEDLVAGEIDVALTNHYYILRLKHGVEEGEFEGPEEEEEEEKREEEGAGEPGLPLATHYFASGDVGNLALVTGIGVLKTAKHEAAALEFIRFLLSEEAQAYAAEEVGEYPVVASVSLPGFMLPQDKALELSPAFDFEQLRDLEETLDLLREADLL